MLLGILCSFMELWAVASASPDLGNQAAGLIYDLPHDSNDECLYYSTGDWCYLQGYCHDDGTFTSDTTESDVQCGKQWVDFMSESLKKKSTGDNDAFAFSRWPDCMIYSINTCTREWPIFGSKIISQANSTISGYQWAMQLLNGTTSNATWSWQNHPYFFGGCGLQWPSWVCDQLRHPDIFTGNWVPSEILALNPLDQDLRLDSCDREKAEDDCLWECKSMQQSRNQPERIIPTRCKSPIILSEASSIIPAKITVSASGVHSSTGAEYASDKPFNHLAIATGSSVTAKPTTSLQSIDTLAVPTAMSQMWKATQTVLLASEGLGMTGSILIPNSPSSAVVLVLGDSTLTAKPAAASKTFVVFTQGGSIVTSWVAAARETPVVFTKGGSTLTSWVAAASKSSFIFTSGTSTITAWLADQSTDPVVLALGDSTVTASLVPDAAHSKAPSSVGKSFTMDVDALPTRDIFPSPTSFVDPAQTPSRKGAVTSKKSLSSSSPSILLGNIVLSLCLVLVVVF